MSQALEQEIVAHEPMINSVSQVAEQMVNKEHFASTDVQHKLQHLLHELDDLRRLVHIRKLQLADSLESQTVR